MNTNHNIFFIPIGHYLGAPDDGAYVIAYSPLVGKMVVGDRQGITETESYLTVLSGNDVDLAQMTGAVKSASELQKMAILPNHTCNFNCSYCYSAKGRSSDVLGVEKLDTALEFFINPSRLKQRHLSISFIGGGEPLLSWALVKHGMEYARQLAVRHGFKLLMTITTNGSIMNEEIISSLKAYDVMPNISFDIDKTAQNKNRRNFDLVCENIEKLCCAGLIPVINATITPDTVNRMVNMFNFVHSRFPQIRDMVFEPVVSNEVFPTPESLGDFYRQYLDNFFSARSVAVPLGKNITSRIFKNVDSILERGCPSKFAITPQGDISICYCTSSPKEKMYAERIYGTVSKERVTIDNDAFDRINGINLQSYPKCNECFAKWHCGGGCMCPNDLYDVSHLDKICEFTREMICRALLERIERQCVNDGFASLSDYIKQLEK